MYGASVDVEYSVYPSYNGIKSELYYRTFMVLFLKIFYVLFSVFTQYYFQKFLEKDFWNFFPKSLENSIGIISQISIPTILNPWTVSVWRCWRMYGLSVWRIKSPAGIFPHIRIRASGCESPYTKRKPRRPCQGFLRKYCYENMEKIFVLFSHFLFLFILLFFHWFILMILI